MVSANFKDWIEVTEGIYRYAISANAAYEIHINYWNMKTNILSADASLYIVRNWHYEGRANTVERKCLLDSMPVMACVGKAIEDSKENNTTS